MSWFIMRARHPANASAASTFLPDIPDPPTPPAGVPSWLATITPQTWGTIAGGQGQTVSENLSPAPPDDGPTGAEWPISICNNWCGAAAVTAGSLRRFFLPATGGHNGGYTNECYVLDLTDTDPSWRLYKPTGPTGSGTDGFNSIANYSDGQCRPPHTYNHVTAAGPYVWHTGIDAMSGLVGYTSAVHYKIRADKPAGDQTAVFEHVGNPMPTDGHLPPFRIWLGGGAAYDPTTNRIFACGQGGFDASENRFVMTDPDTGTFTLFNTPAVEVGYNWIVVADELRLLIVGGYAAGTRRVWYANIDTEINAGTNTITWHGATLSGTDHICGMGQQAHYHHPSRALFTWHGDGANIRKCAIPQALTGTWAQSSVAPAPSNAVTPSAGEVNGTFGRFQLIRDVGGVDVFALLNAIGQPTYVYRIPGAGL